MTTHQGRTRHAQYLFADLPENRLATSTTNSTDNASNASISATPASSSLPSPSADTASTSTATMSAHKSKAGAIAGGVIGALAGVLALGLLSFIIVRRSRRSQMIRLQSLRVEPSPPRASFAPQFAFRQVLKGNFMSNSSGDVSTGPDTPIAPYAQRYYVRFSVSFKSLYP